jgi:hypothetical protein
LKRSFNMMKWDLFQGCKNDLCIHKSFIMIYNVNKMKVKNHIITSICSEKYLKNIQLLFWLKKTCLTKSDIEGMCLNTIKAVWDKLTLVITLNHENLKAFYLWSRIGQGYSHINKVLKVLVGTIMQENKIRKYSNWQRRSWIVFFYRWH